MARRTFPAGAISVSAKNNGFKPSITSGGRNSLNNPLHIVYKMIFIFHKMFVLRASSPEGSRKTFLQQFMSPGGNSILLFSISTLLPGKCLIVKRGFLHQAAPIH